MKPTYGEHVSVAMDGHVAVVTIDKPPHNFVSVTLMRDLADALEAVDGAHGGRVAVLQAAGKSFCAGADFASPDDSVASGMGGITALYEQAVRLFSIDAFPVTEGTNATKIQKHRLRDLAQGKMG